MKTCSACQMMKPFHDFSLCRANSDGLQGKCKLCAKSYRRAHYLKNSEKQKQQNKEWRKANPERQKELHRNQMKKYYLRDTNKILTRNKAWRSGNSEKVKNSLKNWYLQNSHVVAALRRRYQLTKLKATPAWADQTKIKLLYEEAQFATEFFGIPFHVDHIVPIQSDLVCGLHWEGNLQVLKGTENLAKGNRYWPDMPCKETRS